MIEDDEDKLETVFPLPLWFVLFVTILFGGCAEVPKSVSPRTEVCMVQLLGQTDSGVPVAALTCVTPEQFAESQK